MEQKISVVQISSTPRRVEARHLSGYVDILKYLWTCVSGPRISRGRHFPASSFSISFLNENEAVA